MDKVLSLPDFPTGESLKKQHLEAVLHGGTVLLALFHEASLIGIVKQIVQQMVGGETLVRYIGTRINLGVHAKRGGVDNDGVLTDYLRSQLLVGESVRISLLS